MPDSENDQIIDEPSPLPLWQEIQKRTFTNWVNLRLSPSFINDLFTDMSDGLQLIKLIEILTEKNLGRRNKRIEHVNQRLDNVAIALDFLQEKEGINLTNIGPTDIVERNPKLILGLMWILFRHYTIAKALPMLPHEIGQKSNDKSRLLQWIRNRLPTSFPVSNLTSDWNDGFALAALVEECVPGLKVGWREWDPTTPLENTKKAMDLAQEHLGIDKVISPEDLISSDVDEISVMAYLTNFPLMVEAKKQRGFLNNVDKHPITGIKSQFQVKIVDPNHIPKVEINKIGDESQTIPIELSPSSDSHVFDGSFVPPVAGPYEITLKVALPDELPENRKPDATLRIDVVEGPGLKGLNSHPYVGESQHLKVYNSNSQDVVRIEILGPENSRILVPMSWNPFSKEFEGTFTPQKAGHHSVNVLCNSRNIKGSPFPARVQELPNPEFWGRGLCENLRAGEPAIVLAEYPKHFLPADAQRFLAGAKMKVKANNREVLVKEKVKDNQKIFTYVPEDVCTHEVTTFFNGKEIGKHSVNAQYPSTISKAFGPGTETGMENQKALFVIERSNDEDVQFSIEGPAPSELNRYDLDDNTAVVEYTPSAPGKYYVSVCDSHGQNVQNSPFAVNINEQVQGFYPDKAKISELARIVKVNEVVQFTADTRPAHSLVSNPTLIVYDPEGQKIETRVDLKRDGTYRCSFCPRIVGHHKVFVTLDGVTIPPCPVVVACVDPEKIFYSGPGIDEPAPYPSPNQTHFVIDAKQAGPGNVEVEMVDNEKQKVDVEVTDEKDGSYTVKYRAPKPGAYKIKVVFAGFPLPNFEINVQQPTDASGARVEGLENENQKTDSSKCVASGDGLGFATVNEIAEFNVDTSEAGPGDLAFIVEGPNSSTTIVDYTPGNCAAVYTPTHPGVYKISALFGNNDENRDHIPGSPFTVIADYPRDPAQIIVLDPNAGDPIQRVAKGISNSFIIDATKTAYDVIVPETSCLGPNDLVKTEELEPKIWKLDYTLNSPTGRTVPIDVKYGEELLSLGPVVEVLDYLPENLKILDMSSKPSNNFEKKIEIDPRNIGKFDTLTADVKKLYDNKPVILAEVYEKETGLYDVIAKVKEPGEYGLNIYADGSLINEKPIEFSVFKQPEAKNCVIRSIPKEWILNKPGDILIEHGDDGKEISVINEGQPEDLTVEIFSVNSSDVLDGVMNPSKLEIVRLTPRKLQPYKMYFALDDQKIKDSDLQFVPIEKEIPQKLSEDDQTKAYSFALGSDNANKKITAFAIDPDKQLVPLEVAPIDFNGNVRVTGTFKKPGRHSIFLLKDGELLSKHIVRELVSKQVATAHGPGLLTATVGEPAIFDIVCPDRGQVKVNVKGPKGVKIEMEQKMENSCTVRWTPEVPGTYEVLIFINKSEMPTAGSPYHVTVNPEPVKSRKTSWFSCADASEVTFDCGKNVLQENLKAVVVSPDSKQSECPVRSLGNNKIALSFKPKVIGDYKFTVLEKSQELPHSPFYVKVHKHDIPNPANVHMFGDGLQHAVANQDNEFFIDTTKAGYGSLLATIDGPAVATMKCVRTQEKFLRIIYNPPVPGNYQISATFDDQLVPKCPYTIECVSTPLKVSPNENLPRVEANKKAEIHMYIPNGENGKLQATIIDPNYHKFVSTVESLGNGFYSIQLRPVHFGKYSIHVTQNENDIEGSPFTFEAGQRQPSNADKVKVVGTGIKLGQVGVPQTFTIHTNDAGPGVVNAVIDGPEPVRAKLKDLKDGRVVVEYIAFTPGHYFITVLFNGVTVRDTPYCVYLAPNKVLSGKKKQNGIHPSSPTRSLQDQKIHDIKEQKQTTSFPSTPVSTPEKVTTTKLRGDGLESGKTGIRSEFDILPIQLSESNYSVEIYGPSKVDLSTENTKDGIRVKYVPYAPGDYVITVKNEGISVNDSPIKVHIEGRNMGGKGVNETTVIYTKFYSQKTTTVTQYGNGHKDDDSLKQVKKFEANAEDIIVEGSGVRQFIPGKPAMFRIDNVGFCTLFVGVITAYGPCQQVSVNNCGQGSFLVTYVINDRTPGYIYIRYGDKDVTGSPLKTIPIFH